MAWTPDSGRCAHRDIGRPAEGGAGAGAVMATVGGREYLGGPPLKVTSCITQPAGRG